jgi:hypothetical protein
MAALLFAGVVGCGTAERGPKVVSLTGVPGPGLTLEGQAAEGFTVHGLEASQEADGLLVSGHVGPPARISSARPGHVDVRVLSQGREVTRTSGALEPISASPKTFVERRFRVVVPGAVPPGSQVQVIYHASEELCGAAASR